MFLLSYPFLLEALDNPSEKGGNNQQEDDAPSLAHLQEELDSIKKRGKQRKKLREQRKKQRHQPHQLEPDESDYESSSTSDDEEDGDDDGAGTASVTSRALSQTTVTVSGSVALAAKECTKYIQGCSSAASKGLGC